jgi:hypothetical protein
MQIFVIERFTIPSDWLETKGTKQVDYEAEIQEHNFKDMQRELDIMEEGAMWSKSSSMSTINLRDQPIIFEKEKSTSTKSNTKIVFQNLLVVRLVRSAQFMSFVYQIVVITAIIGALKVYLFFLLLYLRLNSGGIAFSLD